MTLARPHPPSMRSSWSAPGRSASRWRSTWPARVRRVLLLDDDDTVSVGSRAICWSKRTLEILDRLGVGERLLDKGVTWHTGKRLLPRPGDLPVRPAARGRSSNARPSSTSSNITSSSSASSARQEPADRSPWQHRVTGVERRADGVARDGRDADGAYALRARLADRLRRRAKSRCAGCSARSSRASIFEDRFLIADVRMRADFPPERWFWFDPPFHPGRSALLHRQADDIWRIDLQLGRDADPEDEKKPERVDPAAAGDARAGRGRSSSNGSASTLPVPPAASASATAA